MTQISLESLNGSHDLAASVQSETGAASETQLSQAEQSSSVDLSALGLADAPAELEPLSTTVIASINPSGFAGFAVSLLASSIETCHLWIPGKSRASSTLAQTID